MEGQPKLEDSGIWKKEAFAKAESPSILIEILTDVEEYSEVAKLMSLKYKSISAKPTAEEYLDLINCAPEENEIRKVWENLLNTELVISSDSPEDFIEKLALIPNVPSSIGDKSGAYYSEIIGTTLASIGGSEDSSGFKSVKMLQLINSLPRSFLIREKAKEFF